MEFKYLGYVLDESGTDGAECSRNVVRGKRVAGAIRSQVKARDLQLKCANLALNIACCLQILRQSYGRRDLELKLYRWKTSKDC